MQTALLKEPDYLQDNAPAEEFWEVKRLRIAIEANAACSGPDLEDFIEQYALDDSFA